MGLGEHDHCREGRGWTACQGRHHSGTPERGAADGVGVTWSLKEVFSSLPSVPHGLLRGHE